MPPARTPSRVHLQDRSQQRPTRHILLTQARNLILQARQTPQTQLQTRRSVSNNDNTQGDSQDLRQLQLDIERVIRWEGRGWGDRDVRGRGSGRVGEELQSHGVGYEGGNVIGGSGERSNFNNNENLSDDEDEYQEYELSTWIPANRSRPQELVQQAQVPNRSATGLQRFIVRHPVFTSAPASNSISPGRERRSLAPEPEDRRVQRVEEIHATDSEPTVATRSSLTTELGRIGRGEMLEEVRSSIRQGGPETEQTNPRLTSSLRSAERFENRTNHNLRYTDLSRINDSEIQINSLSPSPTQSQSQEQIITSTTATIASRETGSILPARIEFPETSLFVRELSRRRALQHVRRVNGDGEVTWDTRYTLLSRTDQEEEEESEEGTIRRHILRIMRNSNISRNSVRIIIQMLNTATVTSLPVPETVQLVFHLGLYIRNRLDLRPDLGETTFVPEAAVWHALHVIWVLDGPGGWMPDRRMHQTVYENWMPSDHERIAQLMDFENGVPRSEWQPMDYQRLLPRELREQLRIDANYSNADVDEETFQRVTNPLTNWVPDEQTHRQIEEGRPRILLITNFGTHDAPDIVITESGHAVSGELRIADQYRIFNSSQLSVWPSLGIPLQRPRSFGIDQVVDLEFLHFIRERGRPHNLSASEVNVESASRYTLLLSVEGDALRTDGGLIQNPITPVQFRRNHRWLYPMARFILLRAIEDGLRVVQAQHLLDIWFVFLEGREHLPTYRLGIIILAVAVLEGLGGWRPSEQMYNDLHALGQIGQGNFAMFSAGSVAELVRRDPLESIELDMPWEEADTMSSVNDVMGITETARAIAYITLTDSLSPAQARSNFESNRTFFSTILQMVWFPEEFEPQANGLYGDKVSQYMGFQNGHLSEEGRREMRQMLDFEPDINLRQSLLLWSIALSIDTNSLLRCLPSNRLFTRYEERVASEIWQLDSRRSSPVFLMTAFMDEWRLHRTSPHQRGRREREIVQQGLDWDLPIVFVEQIVRCWAIVSAWALIEGQAEQQSRWTEVRADRLDSIFRQEVEIRNRHNATTPDSWDYWGIRQFVHRETTEAEPSNDASSENEEENVEADDRTDMETEGVEDEQQDGHFVEQTDTETEIVEIGRQMANLAIDEDTEAAYTQALTGLPSAEIIPLLQLRANPYLSEKEVWHMAHRWTTHRACIETSRRVEAQRDWIRNWMNEVEATEDIVEHNNEERGIGNDND